MKPIVVMTQTHRFTDTRAEIVHLPLQTIRSRHFDQTVLHAHYHWLIFTSKNAVKQFLPYLQQTSYSWIAVIGEKTKAYCEAQGLTVDFCPDDYAQEGFLATFPITRGERLLIPSSRHARPLLYDTLKARGLEVTKIDLYETQKLTNNIEKAIDLLTQHHVDALTFASASAVKAFFEHQPPQMTARIYAIGRQTAQAIHAYGYTCSFADIQTLEAMITKILEERVQ